MGLLGATESLGDGTFRYQRDISPCTDERCQLIAEGHEKSLRSFISGARFEGTQRTIFNKPDYLFGNASKDEDTTLGLTEEPWFAKIGNSKFCLLAYRCHHLLSFFMSTAKLRIMNWQLTPSQDFVHVGELTAKYYYRSGLPRPVISLHPGVHLHETSAGENFAQICTFLNQFVAVDRNFHALNFRVPGWVNSAGRQWWSRLTSFALEEFETELQILGLYEAVKVTCYGIEISVPNFYTILELYCPATGTFFTPIGEMGLALHEIWDISRLPFGSAPYEELFPCQEYLERLSARDPNMFDIYWEMMSYFKIYIDFTNSSRGSVNNLKS